METLMEHLPVRWEVLAAIAVVCIPILVLLRKYVVPVALWTIEICVYMAAIHLVLHGVARLAGWFRTESQIRELGDPVRYEYTTPIPQFWVIQDYRPQWLFYFELVLLVLVTIAVFRYRPMKIQRVKPKYGPQGRLAAQHAGKQYQRSGPETPAKDLRGGSRR